MLDALDLSTTETILLVLIVFAAAVVRGFSGFALSAVVMASATSFLPPITIIPLLWWQEMTASLMMVRKGWAGADKRVVIGLVVGSTIGVPLGLWLTTSIPVETSKTIALTIIIILAATQLAKIRLSFLATNVGLYGTGIVSGIVTGLANVGGMIVALYILAQNSPARSMRSALVVFLFLSAFTSLITQLWFGVMRWDLALAALTLVPATILGVFIGTTFFTERFEPYYKPFCLTLLVGLAGVNLIRLAF